MPRTPLLALLTLSLCAATAPAQSSGPFQGYMRTGNSLNSSTQTTRWFTEYATLNLTHGFSEATAAVVGSTRHGTLGASVTSLGQFAGGTAQVSLQQRVVFDAFGGAASQPVELFFDGLMGGPSGASGYAALGRFRLTVFDASGYIRSSRTLESRGSRYTGALTVQDMLVETLALNPGRNEFTFEMLLMVQANQGWTADFAHTAHLFVPQVEGVTMHTAGGFLSEQSRPDWSTPVTVTPEPASLALTGTGLLGVLVAVRRRQRAAA